MVEVVQSNKDPSNCVCEFHLSNHEHFNYLTINKTLLICPLSRASVHGCGPGQWLRCCPGYWDTLDTWDQQAASNCTALLRRGLESWMLSIEGQGLHYTALICSI